MLGIKQAIYKFQASTHDTADKLLATAFAERRFMLGKVKIAHSATPMLTKIDRHIYDSTVHIQLNTNYTHIKAGCSYRAPQGFTDVDWRSWWRL